MTTGLETYPGKIAVVSDDFIDGEGRVQLDGAHTVGMMMCLNRKLHKAYQRTRDANFSLEGLVGFNFHGKTVGVIGSGKIGLAAMRILKGLGMNILCYDPYPNPLAVELGAKYVELDELYQESDVISLHCPMSKENYHLLDATAFEKMKNGVMIVNTSRGELLDSTAAIEALKQSKIGALGLDVYDNEKATKIKKPLLKRFFIMATYCQYD